MKEEACLTLPPPPPQGKRHILFVTGTRADFGKMKSLIKSVRDDPDFEYSIFATGMHLLKKYDKTIAEIKKENLANIFPYFNQTPDTGQFMDLSLSETIKGLSYYTRENQCDLIVVHGDRIEALAGAIVGCLRGIRTAHIEGGERSGTVDEAIRHAISKLAHTHFTATAENRKRLLQLGENDANIFVIGSPDIDIMLNENLPSLRSVRERYEIGFSDYNIFIYHPVVTELDRLEDNIEKVINGLILAGKNYIVIYPNNDHGSDIILKKLEKVRNLPNFRIFPSIRFENFLTLLKNASAVIGNSSCGIHEAPVYGVPTINIGTRQQNRFSAPSILTVPEDESGIAAAIANNRGRFEPLLTYGKGDSARLFMRTLHKKEFWSLPLQKSFLDLI